MPATSDRWLAKLAKLRKGNNNAPHKPLLLLVFLELVESGKFVSGSLPLTGDLAFRFNTFFQVVKHRRPARPDVRLPFYHLHSDGFWEPRMSNGQPSHDPDTTAYVIPDSEFADACRDPEFRRLARQVLILTHFEPAERNWLYHLVGIPVPTDDEVARQAFFVHAHDAEAGGRNGRFRIDVVSAYDYTCALTGYRVTTIFSGAIVDAAHIHQFSESQNNDIRNGVALCKNAHWQFDRGLWSIDDDYRVLVASHAFSESSPNQKSLADMEGERLLLPSNPALWPAAEYVAWHRKNRFLRCA
jgi:putative restriction endonuclease